jgi:glucoamylase
MLPEQIWDYTDIPSKGMYLGRSAGSAQPLVWAHAEYLKLLRSAADGRVFDRISVVEARYAVPRDKRTFTNHIEIFEVTRPISMIASGYTLRIVDREHFRVVYTFDNWATTNSTEAHSVGYPGSFIDIPTVAGQTGDIIFTLAWPGQDNQERWLGRNIDVAVVE